MMMYTRVRRVRRQTDKTDRQDQHSMPNHLHGLDWQILLNPEKQEVHVVMLLLLSFAISLLIRGMKNQGSRFTAFPIFSSFRTLTTLKLLISPQLKLYEKIKDNTLGTRKKMIFV